MNLNKKQLALRFGTLVAAGIALWPAASEVRGVVYRNHDDDKRALKLGAAYPMVCSVSMDGCGTLIAKRWVLTAAHVARGISPFEPVVRFGDDVYSIKAVYVHPEGISDGRRPPRVDLALLELVNPVGNIEPAALCHGGDDADALVAIVGPGDVGIADQQPKRSDGQLRGVRNAIERASDDRLVVRFDPAPDGVELEGVGAPGDSGGGLFLIEDGLVPTLAGVSSASMGGRPGSYGVQDVYVRVSGFTRWISETMAQAPEGGKAMPEVIDVRDDKPNLRDSVPTRCLADLLDAWASADDQTLIDFALQYRSDSARDERSDAQWMMQIKQLRQDLGPLKAERIAIYGDERAIAQVFNEQNESMTMEVMLDDHGKLNGIGFGPTGRASREAPRSR